MTDMTGEEGECCGTKGWKGCWRERQVWVTRDRATWIGQQTQTEVGQRAGPILRTSEVVSAEILRTLQTILHVLAH